MRMIRLVCVCLLLAPWCNALGEEAFEGVPVPEGFKQVKDATLQSFREEIKAKKLSRQAMNVLGLIMIMPDDDIDSVKIYTGNMPLKKVVVFYETESDRRKDIEITHEKWDNTSGKAEGKKKDAASLFTVIPQGDAPPCYIGAYREENGTETKLCVIRAKPL